MNREKYEYAGKKMRIKSNVRKLGGEEIEVEDYWQNIHGNSWMFSNGNPAAILYGIRAAEERLPIDNEVVYGKIQGAGVLVHVSELEIRKEGRTGKYASDGSIRQDESEF